MAAAAVRPNPGRHILLVEDDLSICAIIRDVLTEIELQTICVQSDREAYAILPTLPMFSALLVDINLGAGTTGYDVARFARQVIPDLPVIYVSGQASPESFRAFGVVGSHLLAKPFTAEELLSAVRPHIPAND